MKPFLLTVFTVGLFCCLLMLSGCGSQAPKRLQVGDSAPSFARQDISGTVISLEHFRGKAVVLRFFLPDCKFCKADTKVFNDFYQRYHAKGLQIIYIDTSPEGNHQVDKFVKDLNIQFPVIHDTTGEIAADYLIKVVPQAVILSPDLKIKGAILGGVSEAELNQLLLPYLNGKG